MQLTKEASVFFAGSILCNGPLTTVLLVDIDAVCLDPIAHRYVTSVGVWLLGGGLQPPPPPPPYLHLYLLSPVLYLNWPQLPADMPCVQDRQRDDASWFNYVYNIAIFLINSSHSLQPPWDLNVGGESFDF